MPDSRQVAGNPVPERRRRAGAGDVMPAPGRTAAQRVEARSTAFRCVSGHAFEFRLEPWHGVPSLRELEPTRRLVTPR